MSTQKNTTLIKLNDLFDKLLMVLSRIAIFILLIVLFKGLMDNKPVLKPFQVPPSFTKQGMTGALLLTMTLDKYRAITKDVLRNEKFEELAERNLDLSSTVDQVKGLGVNINAVLNIIRKELGIEQKEINLNLTENTDSYGLYIKFPDLSYRQVIIKKMPTKSFDEHMVKVAEKVALEFIMEQNPNVLLSYLHRIGYDLEDFENYAHALKQHPKLDKIPFLVTWGSHLGKEGKNAEGIRKIMEAMELDATHADVWATLANFNFDRGEMKQALENLNKALEFDSTHALTYSYLGQLYYYAKNDFAKGIAHLDKHIQYSKSKDRGYFLKAILYANELQKDSVTHYIDLMNQSSYSPARELRIWSSFYGKLGDRDAMIKYLQRSLDYGFSITNAVTLPPYVNYLQDSVYLTFLRENEIPIPK